MFKIVDLTVNFGRRAYLHRRGFSREVRVGVRQRRRQLAAKLIQDHRRVRKRAD